jgi:hypothetical protein
VSENPHISDARNASCPGAFSPPKERRMSLLDFRDLWTEKWQSPPPVRARADDEEHDGNADDADAR